jgi:hypothetical protein
MVSAPPAAPARPARRRHRDPLGIALTAVVLALGAGTAWWVFTPERFPTAGDRLQTLGTVGQPLFLTIDSSPSGEVELRSATPRLGADSVDADVRVVLCDRPVTRGALPGRAEDRCASLLPLEGSSLRREGSAVLGIEITPRAEGVVVVEGVGVDYRTGLRWGSETTGLRVEVSASS